MALEAVLFDLDNTLMDYAGYKLRTATAAAEEMVSRGFPDTVDGIVRKIFEIYDKHGMEYQKTVYAVTVQYGLKMREGEFFQQAGLIAYNRVKYSMGIQPYPGAQEALAELKEMGLKTAIVTDGPRNKVFQRLILARMEYLFNLVVTHDDTRQHKPHHAPFRCALKKLGVKPGNAMMVGDIVTRDVFGARQLGLVTCHAVFGDRDRRVNERRGGMVKVERREHMVEPDHRINSFRELPPLAARLMR
ncbi:MAG TPA: HAD-IA family hydrolase [Candidatus Bilamarchaeaceae archaeon]|nr:HAD-IA family hydrolase [Candidatus Bilamarchaeaceae archaeon]